MSLDISKLNKGGLRTQILLLFILFVPLSVSWLDCVGERMRGIMGEQGTFESYMYREMETDMTQKDIDDSKRVICRRRDSKLINPLPLKRISLTKNCNAGGQCESEAFLLPEGFKPGFDSHYERASDDVYSVFQTDALSTYAIYRNGEEVFSSQMEPGANGPILHADEVLGDASFSFRGGSLTNSYRNIYYKEETINERYGLDESHYLFSSEDKIGFIGKKNGKEFVFFDGRKVSREFDEIRTESCCEMTGYPLVLYEDGALCFVGRRGEKYIQTEIMLFSNSSLQ